MKPHGTCTDDDTILLSLASLPIGEPVFTVRRVFLPNFAHKSTARRANSFSPIISEFLTVAVSPFSPGKTGLGRPYVYVGHTEISGRTLGELGVRLYGVFCRRLGVSLVASGTPGHVSVNQLGRAAKWCKRTLWQHRVTR